MSKKAKKVAKSKSKGKAKPKRQSKPTTKPSQPQAEKPVNGNPYRPNSMYGKLFDAGSKDFTKREDVIQAVAKQVGKEERVVGYAYAVLRSPSHQSNRGSAEVKQGDLVKLVPSAKQQG